MLGSTNWKSLWLTELTSSLISRKLSARRCWTYIRSWTSSKKFSGSLQLSNKSNQPVCQSSSKVLTSTAICSNLMPTKSFLNLGDCIIKLFELTNCQCDQISRLFFQYFAIYNNEILPKGIQKVPNKGSQLCQISNKPLKCWKIFLNV